MVQSVLKCPSLNAKFVSFSTLPSTSFVLYYSVLSVALWRIYNDNFICKSLCFMIVFLCEMTSLLRAGWLGYIDWHVLLTQFFNKYSWRKMVGFWTTWAISRVNCQKFCKLIVKKKLLLKLNCIHLERNKNSCKKYSKCKKSNNLEWMFNEMNARLGRNTFYTYVCYVLNSLFTPGMPLYS